MQLASQSGVQVSLHYMNQNRRTRGKILCAVSLISTHTLFRYPPPFFMRGFPDKNRLSHDAILKGSPRNYPTVSDSLAVHSAHYSFHSHR